MKIHEMRKVLKKIDAMRRVIGRLNEVTSNEKSNE